MLLPADEAREMLNFCNSEFVKHSDHYGLKGENNHSLEQIKNRSLLLKKTLAIAEETHARNPTENAPLIPSLSRDKLVAEYIEKGLFELSHNPTAQKYYDACKISEKNSKVLESLKENFKDLNLDSTLPDFSHSQNKLGGKNPLLGSKQQISDYNTAGVYLYEQKEKTRRTGRLGNSNQEGKPQKMTKVKFNSEKILKKQKSFVHQISNDANSSETLDAIETFSKAKKQRTR